MNNIILKVLIVICVMFIALPSIDALTLEGGVVYTEETAREEAFKNVQMYRPLKSSDKYFFYMNITDNAKSVQKIKVTYLKLPCVTRYAVVYQNEPLNVYYYKYKYGVYTLSEYDLFDCKEKEYPHKAIKYSATGDLLTVVFRVSEQEQFIYDKNKKLIAHWVDKKGYFKQKGFKGKRNFIYNAEECSENI